jgi:hypothetical protein
MGEQHCRIEDFESFEDLNECLIFCVDNLRGVARKEIAFRLAMSEGSLSLRMKRQKPFTVTELWRYMRVTGDYRPIRYMEWCEKKWKEEEKKGRENGKELGEIRKQVEELLERLKRLQD